MKRLVFCLLAAVFLSVNILGCTQPNKKPQPSPSPAPTVSPRASAVQSPPSPTPAPQVIGSEFEQRVVKLVNIERQRVGHDPLVTTALLNKGARAKAVDMRDNRYFSHTSPTYGSPFAMMRTFGVRYQRAGENIASGYATPEAVVRGWMRSPGHRANILSTKFGKIGVGYAKGGRSGHYWVQWFTD